MPNECIMKRIYDELLTLAEQGHDNFAKKINSILTQYNVSKAEIPTSPQEKKLPRLKRNSEREDIYSILIRGV